MIHTGLILSVFGWVCFGIGYWVRGTDQPEPDPVQLVELVDEP